VAEIERPPHRGIEGVEQQTEEAVVACLQDLDPYRAEPVAQPADRLRRRVETLDPPERREAPGQRDGELEARLRLRGPALELLFAGQAPKRRVELDGIEPGRVEAQEVRRLSVSRVEAALPRGIGEAGRAGV
jgi:hypothetical protein